MKAGAQPPAANARPGAPAAAPAGTNPAAGRTPQADSARQAERAISYGELVGNKGGLTPLLFAVRQGNTAAALALLESGAKVNQVSEGDHTTRCWRR